MAVRNSAGVISIAGNANHVSTKVMAAGAASLKARLADVALTKNSAATWTDHPHCSESKSCCARYRFVALAGSSSIEYSKAFVSMNTSAFIQFLARDAG